MRLTDMPLWRLLVELDDAERLNGPRSPTTRALTRIVQDRLKKERQSPDCQLKLSNLGIGSASPNLVVLIPGHDAIEVAISQEDYLALRKAGLDEYT